MKTLRYLPLCLLLLLPAAAHAEHHLCEGFGPQTPRDISSTDGENPVIFSIAPPHDHLNLCNIHFHKQAEHKGPGFSIFAGEGTYGGYQCNETPNLTKAQLEGDAVCENIKPGDTIEVHWVHSSCTIEPGPTLGACLSEACHNPNLRVETQVFLVVNDEKALDFMEFTNREEPVNGYYQAKAIPGGTGTPVEFLGSTTGPKLSDKTCSNLQVTWNVRPQCAMVDIASLERWCDDNIFDEKKGHGVRALVTAPELLSKIGD